MRKEKIKKKKENKSKQYGGCERRTENMIRREDKDGLKDEEEREETYSYTT